MFCVSRVPSIFHSYKSKIVSAPCSSTSYEAPLDTMGVEDKTSFICIGGCTWIWLTWLSATFSWDDWVPQDRLRKFTEENRELATTLRREAEAAFRQKSTKASAKKRGGSDRSSARGSEERQMSVPGRGTKRARDNDIEKVSLLHLLFIFKNLSMAMIWPCCR